MTQYLSTNHAVTAAATLKAFEQPTPIDLAGGVKPYNPPLPEPSGIASLATAFVQLVAGTTPLDQLKCRKLNKWR